jgi:hypothetical protein
MTDSGMATTEAARVRAEELARALRRAGADHAVETFRMAVRPIYGASDRGKPDQIGSAVLLKLDGRHLLVTAAHVIDENASTSLYVAGASSIELLELEFYGTNAPEGDRNRDHYDFAFAELSPGVVDVLGAVKFVEEHECRGAGADDARRLFTAVGFPNSRNKPPFQTDTKVKGQLYQYSHTHRLVPALVTALGVSGREHLFIEHRKHAFDETGRKVSAIAPRGISGGAILESFDFNDRDLLNGLKLPTPLLAGITIERYPEYEMLVGTRIDTIVRAIRRTLAAPRDEA